MKKALLLLLCFSSLHASDTSKFSIYERAYTLSNYFEFSDEGDPYGLVIKKRFAYLHLTNTYDLYDPQGEFEARGASRLLCLGALFSWATEIDVYDAKNKRIGFIDGQIATLASAKFSIYTIDKSGAYQRIGTAFMDHENRSFSIFDPKNSKRQIASLRRIFLPHVRDHWECRIHDSKAIDPRIIKIFAAFSVDHQEYFRPDA
jgi:hypothetical protein